MLNFLYYGLACIRMGCSPRYMHRRLSSPTRSSVFWEVGCKSKTSQPRSKQTFLFQRNYTCFISNNSFILIHYFNTYLITSNKSNIKLHYTYVFTFLKKNTDNPTLVPPVLPPSTDSRCWSNKDLFVGECFPKSMTLLLTPPSRDLGRSLERFLHKIEVTPAKDLPLSTWKHASKEAR